MKNAMVIALGMMAGAAVIDGCADTETATTAATSTTTSSSSAGGSGGTGTEVGGSGGGGASGGMGGAGGAGGGAMGASPRCQMCVAAVYENDAGCQAAIEACDADPACNDWKNCSEDCFTGNDTVACYDACDQSFPHDAALGDPLLECTCDACANVCPATCS